MRTRIASLAFGAIAAAALVVAPVSAAGGSAAATITLDVNFVNSTETFTATGAFCPSGSADSVTYAVRGGGALVFKVGKTFTCDDGSGTLSIRLSATTSARFDGTSGGWTVTGGTGAYAGASGGGGIKAINVDTGLIDTYSGTISR